MLPSIRHRGGLRFGSGVAFAVRVTVVFSLSLWCLGFPLRILLRVCQTCTMRFAASGKARASRAPENRGLGRGIFVVGTTEGALYSASQKPHRESQRSLYGSQTSRATKTFQAQKGPTSKNDCGAVRRYWMVLATELLGGSLCQYRGGGKQDDDDS